jgi:hypothetical protein
MSRLVSPVQQHKDATKSGQERASRDLSAVIRMDQIDHALGVCTMHKKPLKGVLKRYLQKESYTRKLTCFSPPLDLCDLTARCAFPALTGLLTEPPVFFFSWLL